MARVISAKLDAAPYRFAIVASRFNEFISSRLLAGAMDALLRHGADAERITQVWVPGSFEIPLAAQVLAESEDYDAVICVGCLIRGETPHFDQIAGAVARSLSRVALKSGVPVSLGVLTVDSLEQAIDRAGAKQGNKGAEAALAAIEMANLMAALES
jgi:6,7-dimethyl-8-ribityllumazine synthase